MRDIPFRHPVQVSWAAVYQQLPEGLRDPERIRQALQELDLDQLESEERSKVRLAEFEPGDRLPSGHDPREANTEGARALYGHFIRGVGRAYCVFLDGQLSVFQTTDLRREGGPVTAERLEDAANEHAADILAPRYHSRIARELAERIARQLLGIA